MGVCFQHSPRNIVTVQITIILIFIAEVAIAITKVTIVRLICIIFTLLLLYILVFRDDRTQVELAYAYGAFYVVCAVTIYLTSIIFDRFLIRKYADSFILNWVLVFFFALSACTFLGGRPAYESQLYFVSFLGDSKFLVIILTWSLLFCSFLHFLSQKFIAYLVVFSITGLVALVFIHPIIKAAAVCIIMATIMLAQYVLIKNARQRDPNHRLPTLI